MPSQHQGPRSLTPEESQRVRVVLERMIEEVGTQSELARRLGVSPQAVSRVLKGEQAGVTLARRLADATGQRIEQIIGASGSDTAAPLEPRLSNLSGWEAAESEARRRFKYVPEAAWDAVRNIRTAKPPQHVTAEWIGAIASDWARALESPDE